MITLAPVQEAAAEVAAVIDSSCWDQTVQVAADVGNWISDAAVHTAVWIKDAAVWLAEGAVIVWDFVCDIAIKVYSFLAPYFVAFGEWVADTAVATYEWVADFINKYPVETIVGAIALVIGAVFALLIDRLCGLCCGSSAVDSRLIIPNLETIVGQEEQLIARKLGEGLQALGNNPTDAQVKEVVVGIVTEKENITRPADVLEARAQIDTYWNSGVTNALNLISFFLDQNHEINEALPDAVKEGLGAVAALPPDATIAGIETALINAIGVPAAQEAAVRTKIQALPVATTSSLAYAKAACEALGVGLGKVAAADLALGADRGPIATMIVNAMGLDNYLKNSVRAAILDYDSSHLAPDAIPLAIAECALAANQRLEKSFEKACNAALRAGSNADRNVVAGLIIAAMEIDPAHHAVVTHMVIGADQNDTPRDLARIAYAAIPAPHPRAGDLIERARIAVTVAQAAPGNQRNDVIAEILFALNIQAPHAAVVAAAISVDAVPQGTPQNLAAAAVNAYRASQQAVAAQAAAAQAAADQAVAARRQEMIGRAQGAIQGAEGMAIVLAQNVPFGQMREALATHMITAMGIAQEQHAAVRAAITDFSPDATPQQLAQAAVGAIPAAAI